MFQQIKEDSYEISLQNIQYYSRHIHLGIEILLVIRGEIEVTVNQSSCLLAENDLLLINANHVHSINGNKENVVLSLKIPYSLVEQQYQHIHDCYFELNSTKEDNRLYLLYDQIRQILAQVLITYYQKQDGSEIEINSLIYQLLTLLIRNFKTTHLGTNKFLETDDKRIREILAFIEKSYRKPISLEEIAKQQYLSLYYLSRYFKQTVGVSFSQYLKQVRLRSAVKELQYSTHNITQVSLNNGFPNVKAFNKAFKEMYKQTPAEYRNLHKADKSYPLESSGVSEQYTLVNSPDFLIELSKFLSTKNQIADINESAVSVVNIDLPQDPILVSERTNRILIIGPLENALREDVKLEMEIIQESLQFEYIYFNHLFSLELSKSSLLLQNGGQFYYFDTVFRLFKKLGLIPFISVDFEKEVEGNPDYFVKLNQFLQHSIRYFGEEFVEKWQFEWICSNWKKNSYHLFYQTVKKWVPYAKVGIHVTFSLEKGLPLPAAEFLKQSAKECDICCFTCNPNEQLDFTDMGNRSFEVIKDFVEKTCSELKGKLQSAGLAGIPIYLINWNTLYGNTKNLSGSFFRSALIFKDMLDVMKEISGLGFWIDTDILEKNNADQENIEMNGIALFYYYQIKRPAFFNIQLAAKMGVQIMAEGEDFLLTMSEQGYQLAIYNTSYVNPSYSVESFFLRSLMKEKKIVISGLQPGLYQIRKHILDRDNGALYINWLNFNNQDFYDQEIITFLKQRTYPGLQIYEEKIKSDLFLQSTLTINAIHLFEMRPLS